MCRQPLVFESTDEDSESVVGEECHIISGANKGPRSDANYPKEKVDDISNLILLCRVHHKQIDDQVETYKSELLISIKRNHERWVEEKLKDIPEIPDVRILRDKNEIPEILPAINTGKELLNIASRAYSYYFDYGDDFSSDELGLVGEFIQDVKDYSELARELEPIQRIDAAKSLDEELKNLKELGILAFAAIENQKLVGGMGEDSTFPVLHLTVKKVTDSSVVKYE